MLPKKVPNARIFLYQYNSSVVYSSDRRTFLDKANDFLEDVRLSRTNDPQRPLLLVGHSLGGLLIKQALINAYNNEVYSDIKMATKGLAFFATPHYGGRASLVRIGEVAAKIAKGLGFRKGDNIIHVLKDGTLFTNLVDELWKQRLLDYPIVSFWGSRDDVSDRTPYLAALESGSDIK
jgi:Lysophospholipase